MREPRYAFRRHRRTKSQTVRSKQSLPPGSFVYVGREQHEPPKLILAKYDATGYAESVPQLEDCERSTAADAQSTYWLHLHGVHEAATVKELARRFQIHSLTAEDILHTRQRPKAESFPDYLFIVLHGVLWQDSEHQNTRLESGQVALCLGPGFVLSFEESHTDFTATVRRQLTAEAQHSDTQKRKLLSSGPAYLVYALLDSLIDQYAVTVEELSDTTESMEARLLARSTPGPVEPIYNAKRMVLEARRLMLPVQDLVTRLRKPDSPFFPQSMAPVLQDLQDHITSAADNLRDLQEVSTELVNLYMSRASFRMNEVMQTLTVIGSVFIPLTFLTGIFGMNFEHMPELHWPWSYPVALIAMVGLAGGMLYYFRRRRWF